LLFAIGCIAVAFAAVLWLSERKKGAWRLLARSKHGVRGGGRWIAWKKQKPGVR
jgi:hypothetical protein